MLSPKNDIGLDFVKLPIEEEEMFTNNQLGRKSGGGFYRIKKLDNVLTVNRLIINYL